MPCLNDVHNLVEVVSIGASNSHEICVNFTNPLGNDIHCLFFSLDRREWNDATSFYPASFRPIEELLPLIPDEIKAHCVAAAMRYGRG